MTKEASLSGFAKWRRDIADSIYEEISAMMSGHFIPYHKLCFMAAFLTALIFSILFTQMGVIEAPVAVVDLDHSARSAKFIQAVELIPRYPYRLGVPYARGPGLPDASRQRGRRHGDSEGV